MEHLGTEVDGFMEQLIFEPLQKPFRALTINLKLFLVHLSFPSRPMRLTDFKSA